MSKVSIEERLASIAEADRLQLAPTDQILSVARVIMTGKRPVAYLIDIVPVHYLRQQDLAANFNGSVLDLFLSRGEPELLSSRCAINAVTASHQVARALNIQRGDVLLWFGAILYSSMGRVVDYSFSYFLPGYFRFHVVRRVGDMNNSHAWAGSV